jgi:hypothetical protein
MAQLRTVVLSGTQAPGTPEGALFAHVGTSNAPFVQINNSGHTAFRARLQSGAGGVTTADDSGFWSEGGGSLQLVAREGSQAPGTPEGVFFSFDVLNDSLTMNDEGEVAFYSQLLGAGITTLNEYGIFAQRDGNPLMLIVWDGDPVPGVPGALFKDVYNSRIPINNQGEIAFEATLVRGSGGVTAGNERGVWSEGGGTLQRVVRGSEPAPGAPAGATFQDGFAWDFNNVGQIAFRGTMNVGSGGVTDSNDGGYWSEGGGALHLVAREGDPAPGTVGAVFDRAGVFVQLNDAGQTAFDAHLKLGIGDANSTNYVGVWSESGGALHLAARSGDQAPGTSDGVTFSSVELAATSYSRGFNNSGDVVILGSLTGPLVFPNINDRGIWAERSGSLQLVARSGGPAPEGGEYRFGTGSAPEFNNAGQVVFTSQVVVPGPDFVGLFAQDQDGVLHRIARTGSAFDVDDGPGVDSRTINQFGSWKINDFGQIALSLRFTDGSWGVFVSNEVANLSLAGDFNHDGAVDAADYDGWKQAFGHMVEPGSGADGNGDGMVDAADYVLWRNSLSRTALGAAIVSSDIGSQAAQAGVPEPITYVILSAGLVVMTGTSRRRRRFGTA